ncbi:MAG TPA: heparan-alpha-glucosaminide N-acetyltransferase domain-containing protein, partial [Methylomirabilota bacterium]|nr:heparan-alpha-glucosaminide N-acetyltransferase domain-containing protein [Methylomirabilota bacterium]
MAIPAVDSVRATAVGTKRTSRIASMDLVRGVVMLLMAIDHVRVYSGVPPGGPAPGVFFTRWVTHFVAPGFVFLAGTAAYLHGRKLGNRSALAKFLVTRGLWLVLLELTVIRVAWTFNLDFAHYLLAGVIWMLGWCMVLMAAVVYLPRAAIAMMGIAIVALHNVTDLFAGQLQQIYANSDPPWLLKILYFGGAVQLGGSGPPLLILYVLVPWIGVMMAGYAFGAVAEAAPDRRRGICLKLGVAMSAAFVLLRALNLYGDPRPWQGHFFTLRGFLGFLNTTKYPASLEFLLMTLGPLLILWALSEGWKGKVADVVETFGRVP